MTKFAPGGRRGAGGAERSEPVRLTVYGHHTRALFAMKVQHKLRNGVAGRIISGSAESGQNLPISAMLLDPQNVRAEMPAEIDQLGIAGAAAQTRMVSAGEFWPSQQELSRDLKYMARARIPEFESDMPSQTVRL